MVEAQKGVWLGITAYVFLAIAKISIGLWSNSLAVLADGFNNGSDILLSIAILIGLRVAGQPADHDHRYGHHKAESIAMLIAASFMVLAAVQIWLETFMALFKQDSTNVHPLALYISIFSAVLMFAVSYYNFRLCRKTESKSLRAVALDNISDAFVSVGAAIGIGGALLGYAWVDPLTASIVGFIIAKTALSIGKEAVHHLMDGFDPDRLETIKNIVHDIEGIDSIKDIRARQHGKYVHVDMTVEVQSHLSVKESHDLTEEIELKLLGFMQIKHVHIHVEPCNHTSGTRTSLKEES